MELAVPSGQSPPDVPRYPMSSGAVLAVSSFQIWTPDTASSTRRLANGANIEINVGQNDRAPAGR